MQLLLSKTLNKKEAMNRKNNSQATPLYDAIITHNYRHNKIPMMKYMIKIGIDVNAGEGGTIPIKAAFLSKKYDVVKLLAQQGANVNIKMNNEENLLHQAVAHNQIEIADLLIKAHSIHIDALNAKGESALYKAVTMNTDFQNNLGMVKLLVDQGADVNAGQNGAIPIRAAYLKQNDDIIELLIKHGADLTILFDDQKTLLYRAVVDNQWKIVELAIKHDADFTILFDNQETLLHKAIVERQPKVAKLLIERQVDINTLDAKGESPLYKAISNSTILDSNTSYDLADLLIKADANANCGSDEKIPLLYAIRNSKYPEAFLLIRAGADVKSIVVSEHNTTILDLIVHHTTWNLVQKLSLVNLARSRDPSINQLITVDELIRQHTSQEINGNSHASESSDSQYQQNRVESPNEDSSSDNEEELLGQDRDQRIPDERERRPYEGRIHPLTMAIMIATSLLVVYSIYKHREQEISCTSCLHRRVICDHYPVVFIDGSDRSNEESCGSVI